MTKKDERPKLCANCGKLIGLATECPYCGTDNSKLSSRLKRAANKAEGGGMSVTMAILVVNVFLFAVAIIVGGSSGPGGLDIMQPNFEVLFRLGMTDPAAINAGQWWRMVVSVFLHLGLLHVAFNCFVLYVAGRWVEADFGGRFMFLIYMTSGILGFVASQIYGLGGAGASGAVAGLLGALVVRRRLVDGHFRSPITQWVIQLIILNALVGLALSSHINNVAHLGGFLTGGGLSFLLTKVRFGRGGALGLMLATWGVGVLTLVSFGLMALSLFRGAPDDVIAASRCFNEVRVTVERRPFDPEQAAKAKQCLSELNDLESEANDARDRAKASIGAAITAYDEGNTTIHLQSLESSAKAFSDYKRWEAAAISRYGLGYSGGPGRD